MIKMFSRRAVSFKFQSLFSAIKIRRAFLFSFCIVDRNGIKHPPTTFFFTFFGLMFERSGEPSSLNNRFHYVCLRYTEKDLEKQARPYQPSSRLREGKSVEVKPLRWK